MTYAVAAALQQAVYARLAGDAALTALAGDAIFDALPSGALPELYVVLGGEDVRDASDQSGAGAWHRFRVQVVSEAAGFAAAKGVAGAVCDCLVDAALVLARGRLVGLHFVKARASRSGPRGQRQITLTFRARVADDV